MMCEKMETFENSDGCGKNLLNSNHSNISIISLVHAGLGCGRFLVSKIQTIRWFITAYTACTTTSTCAQSLCHKFKQLYRTHSRHAPCVAPHLRRALTVLWATDVVNRTLLKVYEGLNCVVSRYSRSLLGEKMVKFSNQTRFPMCLWPSSSRFLLFLCTKYLVKMLFWYVPFMFCTSTSLFWRACVLCSLFVQRAFTLGCCSCEVGAPLVGRCGVQQRTAARRHS